MEENRAIYHRFISCHDQHIKRDGTMPTYDACRDKKSICEGYMTVRKPGRKFINFCRHSAIFQYSEFSAAARADKIAGRFSENSLCWGIRQPQTQSHTQPKGPGLRVSVVL
jgi:hypothetical protein